MHGARQPGHGGRDDADFSYYPLNDAGGAARAVEGYEDTNSPGAHT